MQGLNQYVLAHTHTYAYIHTGVRGGVVQMERSLAHLKAGYVAVIFVDERERGRGSFQAFGKFLFTRFRAETSLSHLLPPRPL